MGVACPEGGLGRGGRGGAGGLALVSSGQRVSNAGLSLSSSAAGAPKPTGAIPTGVCPLPRGASFEGGGGGEGGMGPKRLCTKNGPIRFSRWQILPFPTTVPMVWGGGDPPPAPFGFYFFCRRPEGGGVTLWRCVCPPRPPPLWRP